MKDGEREGERERALRMGVGYYRARNHQSLRGPAEEEERGGEGCDTVTAGWQTHGNDCVIYPSPVEPEGCVLDMKARIQ